MRHFKMTQRNGKRPPSFWFYFWQFTSLVAIVVILQYCQSIYTKNKHNLRYTQETDLEVSQESHCQHLSYEMIYLRREIYLLRNELEEVKSWRVDTDQNIDEKLRVAFDQFYSDQIGLFDHASEYAGGIILSTPNTVPYPSKYGLRIFGTFDLTVNSEPHLLIQHSSTPGKCYAFYGNKGRIHIRLGRPVVITHVSLEHLRLGENLNSAPKDFQVLGFGETGEENLGYFLYDMDDSIIQTFRVTSQNQTFRSVELRILSNYGNNELTCVYRFRVHSLNLNLK